MDIIQQSEWWMVNWSSITSDQNYVATDKDGKRQSFSEKPSFNGECWTALKRKSEPSFLGVCNLESKQASDTLLSRQDHLLNGLSLLMQHLNELKSKNQSVDELSLSICCALITDMHGFGDQSNKKI
jgi:hypothetical protein